MTKPSQLTLGQVTAHRFQKSVHGSFVFGSSVFLGKVLDPVGKAVYWADVAVSGKTCSPQEFTWRSCTNKKWAFQLPAVPQEPLVVWVSHPYLGNTFLELEGPREGLAVPLEQGRTVNLALEDEGGEPKYDPVDTAFPCSPLGWFPQTPKCLSLGTGRPAWMAGKAGFLEAAAVGLEHEDVLFGLFPNSNENFLLGAPRGLVSSLDYENLSPGFWRVVAVDETCNILRSSKRVLIHSGQTTVISP